MPEMPHSCEDHRDSRFVGGCDHFGVAHRSAGLRNDCGRAGFNRGNDNSRLALRFSKAELKDGKLIPIKATIVGLFPPQAENGEGYNIAAGDQQPNGWNASTLQVDQIGVVSGVDLHSRIAARNSGVFVTTKKDDVKLSSGSELLLAIAPLSKS